MKYNSQMNYPAAFIFGLWLFLLECSTAQQATPPETPEVKGRRAWVVATNLPKGMENPLPVLSDETLHKVPIHLRSIGQAIPVDETGVVCAVKEEFDKDGKVSYTKLSNSTVPEGVSEALIVLVPEAENKDGLKFRSKVIDLSKFKKGGCLYINLVSTSIGITIGEHKTVVKPGGMEFINPLEGKKDDVQVVRFFYEIPKESEESQAEWKLMTSSKMAIYESRREICIFFYNENIKNVDFRGIPFMTPVSPEPRP